MALDKAQRDEYVQARFYHKFYKFFSLLFVVCSVFTFVYLFHTKSGGDPMEFIRKPLLAIFILIPFLPAVLLGMKAKGFKSVVDRLHDQIEEDQTTKYRT